VSTKAAKAYRTVTDLIFNVFSLPFRDHEILESPSTTGSVRVIDDRDRWAHRDEVSLGELHDRLSQTPGRRTGPTAGKEANEGDGALRKRGGGRSREAQLGRNWRGGGGCRRVVRRSEEIGRFYFHVRSCGMKMTAVAEQAQNKLLTARKDT